MIADSVRRVLLDDWDPHNASRSEAASGTYDGYIAPLIALIQGGATEEQVMDWLHEREQETMCFPSLGKERLRRVAQKLILAVGTGKPG
jgi:hypothetical protein